MPVHVDVWPAVGEQCRDSGCGKKATIWLQRPPLPTEYYCPAHARARVDEHRQYLIVTVTDEAAAALEGAAS